MGWVAWTLVFIGVYLLGQHNRAGFLVASSGGVLMMVHALGMGDGSLFVANILMIALHLRNWWKWGREESNANSIRSG